MIADILVPIGVLSILVIPIALVTRLIATGMLNKTIREALRSDPASVAVLAAKLDQRQPSGDALLGWITIALAIGLALLGLFEAPDQRRDLFQVAIFPLIIGVTTLLYCHVQARRTPAA